MGAYADALNRSRAGMSPDQIHKAKNARKHAARVARKNANKAMHDEHMASLPTSLDERLKLLDKKYGPKGGGRQRERLLRRMGAKASENIASQ